MWMKRINCPIELMSAPKAHDSTFGLLYFTSAGTQIGSPNGDEVGR